MQTSIDTDILQYLILSFMLHYNKEYTSLEEAITAATQEGNEPAVQKLQEMQQRLSDVMTHVHSPRFFPDAVVTMRKG